MAKSGRQRKARRKARNREDEKPAATSSEQNGSGGQGVLVLNDRGHERSDLAMVGQAVSQQWPVSERAKRVVTARMLRIVREQDDELALSAADRLIKADALNAKREQIKTPQKHEHTHSVELYIPDNQRTIEAESTVILPEHNGQSVNGNGRH